MTTIIPVIHYVDAGQAMRNAERAVEAGCQSVALIDMTGRDRNGPIFAAAAIRHRWPELEVGINHLGHMDVVTAIHSNIGAGVGFTWTDEQLTHSRDTQGLAAHDAVRAMEAGPPHRLFSAVAFKYQAYEPDPVLAARRALACGFIPTTSGAGTGVPADPGLVDRIRAGIAPDDPLAIASGVTPENAYLYLPYVTHVLVSSGVSSSFTELDAALLRALVEAAA